jgi:uncharacterized protein YjbI with pentapeptide repeats
MPQPSDPFITKHSSPTPTESSDSSSDITSTELSNTEIGQGIEKLRQEFLKLCSIEDPLEQNYLLIHYAKESNLAPDEYRMLYQQFKDDHLSREQQKNLLEDLQQQFEALSRIQNPIERNYRMMHRAKASDIDTEEYRQLFEEYERQSADGLGGIVNNSLHSLTSLASFLGQFTIIVGLILFIAEADNRKQESHTRSWETITASKGSTESAGRIQAIETLKRGCGPRDIESDPLEPVEFFQPRGWQAIDWRNVHILGGFFPDCVSLRGLDIAKAHLPRIDMRWADLSNARMQDSGLWSADLEGAQLRGAQLQRAKLRDAELRGANLEGAQLQNADLAGSTFGCSIDAPHICTNLRRADLTGANLRGDKRDNRVDYTLFHLVPNPVQQLTETSTLSITASSNQSLMASRTIVQASHASLPPSETNAAFGSSVNLDDAVFANSFYDENTKVNICRDEAVSDGSCQPESYISLIDFRDWTFQPEDQDFFNRQGEKENLRNYRCPDMHNGICDQAALKTFRETLDDAFANAHEISHSAKLAEAVLVLAELSDADLSSAKLNSADLRGVRLRDADLTGATLHNADLGCIESQLENNQVILTCANLREANLKNTDMRSATLEGANLEGSDLRRADLSCYLPVEEEQEILPCVVSVENGREGEFLSGANLARANLAEADLREANLAGTNLIGANLAEARLEGATGWTVEQLQAAENWELATYDDEQRSQLGLIN